MLRSFLTYGADRSRSNRVLEQTVCTFAYYLLIIIAFTIHSIFSSSSSWMLLLFDQRSSHAASPSFCPRTNWRVRGKIKTPTNQRKWVRVRSVMLLRHATTAPWQCVGVRGVFVWAGLFFSTHFAYANFILWFMLLFSARFNFHYSCFTSRTDAALPVICV